MNQASPLPTTRDQLAELIPHQGTMCLLECVQSMTADAIICSTRSHAAPDNPLRHNGQLSALTLCEYGAQAMAVHGGLSARAAGQSPRSGLLVALREVHLAVATVEPVGEFSCPR